MKRIATLLLLACSYFAQGQNKVVGFWYGTANVRNGGSTNNYSMEVVVEQNGSTVSGVMNYYFRNSFRSIPLKGTYNTTTRQLRIPNLALTYHGSTASFEVDCMMDFVGTLRVSREGSNLDGRFVGQSQYRNTCPEIFLDMALDEEASKNLDSVYADIRRKRESYALWQPGEADTLVAATILQRPVVNYVVTNQFRGRVKEVQNEIEVTSDSVLVNFYDNGEVDGDSISVFFNDQLLSFNRLLSAKAIQFKIGLDPSKEFNEVTMFADNLGRIAPNTSLMIVYDGNKRHDIRLSSNLEKSATVRIRKKKAATP
ncbi:hypothetical protein SAMN05444008_11693 [Cnuella takakiae]|uniref:Uncharacterized protein n=1 Tax=Cnuella takakiae TaxID=1302690 RepID=A0A1M5GIG2_9BACT|nr:hypothetical protein [Cnuella takakiae]OLY92429.1 hypothetical protein BUE76_11425 [Cnuella takakiae]SHG03498.1 hypothetical protein SAMN05444008_11693 [Cnuella takakiae]